MPAPCLTTLLPDASQGYGFVNLGDVHSASKAMASLEGYKLGEGKSLSVKIAGQKGGGGGSGSQPMGPGANLPRPVMGPPPPTMTPHGPYGGHQRPPPGWILLLPLHI